jgi:acetylglutamate kinase
MAIEQGVPSAHVIGTEVPHALLLELFTEEGVGTMITAGPVGLAGGASISGGAR